MTRIAAGIVLAALTWAPTLAWACSVCMTGREDENRVAFLVTTVFLSVLPLVMIAGLVAWLRRRVHQQRQENGEPARADSLRPPAASAGL